VKRTIEQAATLPAGERLVVIAVVTVLFGPRATLLLLLGWGVLAAGYVLAGQLARSAVTDPGAMGPARRRRPGLSRLAGGRRRAGGLSR